MTSREAFTRFVVMKTHNYEAILLLDPNYFDKQFAAWKAAIRFMRERGYAANSKTCNMECVRNLDSFMDGECDE